jgi:hypothetical protein
MVLKLEPKFTPLWEELLDWMGEADGGEPVGQTLDVLLADDHPERLVQLRGCPEIVQSRVLANQPRRPIQFLQPYQNRVFPRSSGSRRKPLG